jgi:hypothetical protein
MNNNTDDMGWTSIIPCPWGHVERERDAWGMHAGSKYFKCVDKIEEKGSCTSDELVSRGDEKERRTCIQG